MPNNNQNMPDPTEEFAVPAPEDEITAPEAEQPAAEPTGDIAADEPELTEAPESAPEETPAEESVTAEVNRLFSDEPEPAAEPEPAPDLIETDEEYDEFEEYEELERRRKQRAKRRRHRKHKKGRGISCSLVLLTFILASATVLSLVILTVVKEIYGIDKNTNTRNITIPVGATTADIASQLENDSFISLPKMFRLISRLNGMDGKYIAGDHVISASMSYQAMIEELCKNYADEREHVRVTFKEGITLLECAKILEQNEICKADDFLWAFNAGGKGFKFEEYVPAGSTLKFQRMEGYCFPDTYDFYVDEDPGIVVQKIYENFDSKISDAYYKRMEELGMSLDQVVTLASIVQAEAASTSVMRDVSSVFHNRLLNSAIYPQLQSDPTKKYAEDVIRPNQAVPNTIMQDAYNTYKGTGLPPGAINNPGKDAIEAVLYPSDTDYYFFYANVDTGETYFARTNDEHEANIAMVKAQQAAAAKANQ